MQIVDIVPHQIHFLLDFTLEELKSIKFALDKSELHLNLTDAKEIDVNTYMLEVFYKGITDAIKGVEGDKS